MKILLINPSQKMVYGIYMLPAFPPLGLLQIGAVLEKMGQDIRLIDVDIEEISREKLRSIINDFHPALVGITSVTATFNRALGAAQEIKNLRDIPTVLGGIHATVDPAGAIAHPNEREKNNLEVSTQILKKYHMKYVILHKQRLKEREFSNLTTFLDSRFNKPVFVDEEIVAYKVY